jgi:hypothetical protein
MVLQISLPSLSVPAPRHRRMVTPVSEAVPSARKSLPARHLQMMQHTLERCGSGHGVGLLPLANCLIQNAVPQGCLLDRSPSDGQSTSEASCQNVRCVHFVTTSSAKTGSAPAGCRDGDLVGEVCRLEGALPRGSVVTRDLGLQRMSVPCYVPVSCACVIQGNSTTLCLSCGGGSLPNWEKNVHHCKQDDRSTHADSTFSPIADSHQTAVADRPTGDPVPGHCVPEGKHRICCRCGARTALTPRTVNQYSLPGVSPVTLKSRTDLARPSSVFTYRRQD